MLKIGITGGIGSGKSVVSQLFTVLGIPVYVADTESKKLTATSPVIRIKLIELFGDSLYKDDVLDKKLLASYIFNDPYKLKAVNAIIHPEVEKHFLNWLYLHRSCEIVAHEAAILFESGLNALMDKVIMIYAPIEKRINRVMERDNISPDKVMERINNQMPDEDKAALSDYIIYNDDKRSLIEQTINTINILRYNN
ncbi:MAG: dephospho-CoA kinase [Dysgonomonas sp.]